MSDPETQDDEITHQQPLAEATEVVPDKEENDDDDFGDFNDNDDDFDDFEEFVQEQPEEQQQHVSAPLPQQRIDCLNESAFSNSAQLQASVLSILQPITKNKDDEDNDPRSSTPPPPLQHITPKAYFSERSESLWNQLSIISPEVHPIDWKRCSIRRLMLVSLGVPLDLDEILPNKNTKRLILPSSSTTASAGSNSDKPSNDNATKDREAKSQVEVEQLAIETENSLSQWQQLANVSTEACDGMDENELDAHVKSLKAATEKAQELFHKWDAKKHNAEKDKEAFEGVIESLLEYAQRLRRK